MTEEFNVQQTETKKEPKLLIEGPKESPDAMARRMLCISPDTTRAFETLVTMMRYKRPAGSKTERTFIREFIKPFAPQMDKFGNYYVKVGKSNILWSAHTDTVHEKKGLQIVGYSKLELGVAQTDHTGSHCLGADDTTGVWLMLEMIRANRPGLYVFHRQEESGCKGSKYLAEYEKARLKGIEFAIALDRKGTSDVITHQRGDRCCSEDFAKELGAILNRTGMDYKPDPTGSFTDTASYVDIIAECTNLSVGYMGAHGKMERQDLGHAFKLRDALIAFDGSSLKATRKPGDKERRVYTYTYSGRNEYDTRTARQWDDQLWSEWGYVYDPISKQYVYQIDPDKGTEPGYKYGGAYGTTVHHGVNGGGANGVRLIKGKGTDSGKQLGNQHKANGFIKNIDTTHVKPAAVEDKDDDEAEMSDGDYVAMKKLVERNPEAIVDILETYGINYADLRDEIMSIYGVVNC